MEPKYKVGDLLLDTKFDEDGKQVEGELALGEITEVMKPANFEVSGYYYLAEWTDNEGSDEYFPESTVKEFRDKFLEYSEECKLDFGT